jgi:hypothetical protein
MMAQDLAIRGMRLLFESGPWTSKVLEVSGRTLAECSRAKSSTTYTPAGAAVYVTGTRATAGRLRRCAGADHAIAHACRYSIIGGHRWSHKGFISTDSGDLNGGIHSRLLLLAEI